MAIYVGEHKAVISSLNETLDVSTISVVQNRHPEISTSMPIEPDTSFL
jgi:hypothetical protein